MSKTRNIPPFDCSIAWVMLSAKDSVIAPMRPTLRQHDITEQQWRVLRVINDRDLTDAKGLAEVGLLHAPSVTRILKELEERKFIVRESDVHDRRRILVTLTPQGREVVRIVSRQVARIMDAYVDRFGAERLERLTAELRALSAAIKDVD